jgi:hypothetical protein
MNPLHDVRHIDVRRPLDPLPSIKLKLGFVIAAAVAVTIFVFWVGIKIGVGRAGDRVVALARHDQPAARDGGRGGRDGTR